MNAITLTRTLIFTCLVEIITSFALIICPTTVITLLLGTVGEGETLVLGRCFGVAIGALGLASWPNRRPFNMPSFFAMLLYNLFIAIYLMYLGLISHMTGILLWPATILHLIISVMLLWFGLIMFHSTTRFFRNIST